MRRAKAPATAAGEGVFNVLAVVALQPFDQQIRQIQKGQHFYAVDQRIQQCIKKNFHSDLTIYFYGICGAVVLFVQTTALYKAAQRLTAGRTTLSGIRARNRATVRAENGISSLKVSMPKKYCR